MGRVWLQRMVHPARLEDSALIEAILGMIERCPPQVFAAQIRALLDRPDASAVLTAIRCPTLLLCGREDTWSPPARHEVMARLIRGSQLAVVAECAHMVAHGATGGGLRAAVAMARRVPGHAAAPAGARSALTRAPARVIALARRLRVRGGSDPHPDLELLVGLDGGLVRPAALLTPDECQDVADLDLRVDDPE